MFFSLSRIAGVLVSFIQKISVLQPATRWFRIIRAGKTARSRIPETEPVISGCQVPLKVTVSPPEAGM